MVYFGCLKNNDFWVFGLVGLGYDLGNNYFYFIIFLGEFDVIWFEKYCFGICIFKLGFKNIEIKK